MKLFRSLMLASLVLLGHPIAAKEVTLLNVSYDPTREFYQEFNEAFIKYWQKKTGQTVEIQQSHGGSSKQARSIIDGLAADVVTLALAYDIDSLAKVGLLPENWQVNLPHNSTPYTSTVVFLVRKGNPKNIKDWDDLVKPGITVITPNPKTSGGARWNYLAAWSYALQKGDTAYAKAFVTQLFKNVPILDSGARDATTTFIQRGIGDVLIAWENEAFSAVNEIGKGQCEIVVPSISILAEPSAAIVTKNAAKHENEEVAKAYLEYLYSEEGQTIAAKHYFRPRLTSIAKYANKFPQLKLLTINEAFGGWKSTQVIHFDEGGIFDQIYQAK